MSTQSARSRVVRTILQEEEESANSDVDYLEQCLKEFPEHTRLIIQNWRAFTAALYPEPWISDLPLETRQRIMGAAYDRPVTLKSALQFAPMFISHECHDDGEPALLTLINPAYPNGRPPLTPEGWRERRLLDRTPSIPTLDPGTYHVTARIILARPIDEVPTTYAGGLEALRAAIRFHSYAHLPQEEPCTIQRALMSLIQEQP